MSSKYRLFASKTNGKGGDEVDGLDWVEFTIRGGSVALGLVKEASNYAPVPGLQQAASAVLQIVQTIQVRGNKTLTKLQGSTLKYSRCIPSKPKITRRHGGFLRTRLLLS